VHLIAESAGRPAQARGLGRVLRRCGELRAAVRFGPGQQPGAGDQDLADAGGVPGREERVLMRLAERHRPASPVPRRAQPEVPGWAEWASSAMTTSPISRSAARWAGDRG